MRMLTGYMPATEGRATVAGFDIFDKPIEAKRRIGYLPETPPLYPEMTVREYFDFVARIKGVPGEGPKASASTRVMERAASPTWPTATAASSPRATGSASASRRHSSTIPRC